MTEPTFETLLYEVSDNVATITLNRPEKLNASNFKMVDELISAFDVTDRDDAVRAVIVTGAGRAFSAGADLSDGARGFQQDAAPGSDRPQGAVPRDGCGRIALRIFESLKPVIGATNGIAVGAGLTMQLAMDIRIAADDARFGLVFARRGIVMEGASAWFLPRIVGPATALEWAMTGRIFSAQEALDRRLVSAVYPRAELMRAARASAREIADNAAPVSVALNRQLIWRCMGAQHPMEAHIYDSRAVDARSRQPDIVEGVGSFREKRAARFPDTVSADLPAIWGDWSAPRFR